MGCKIYHWWHAESQSTVMVMSFWGGDEKGNDALSLPGEVFKADFHRCRRFEVLQTFRGQKTAPPLDDRKDQYFCWVSINVSSSFSARQQIPLLVSFLPQLEDCFFHQGQRRVTNWAVATSPIPLRPLYRSPPTPLPCILLNHPPTHKPTRLRAPAQALTQTSAH